MTLADLHRAVTRAARAPWCSGKWNLNVLAVRSAAADADQLFDDALVVSYHDGIATRTKTMAVSTDPGRPYRLAPMRPEGCAILAPQYAHLSHGLGLHRGRPALVQAGPLKVWRDGDHDGELDRTGPVYTVDRTAAVNIHDGPGDTDPDITGRPALVGRWSAGCIVTRRRNDMASLLSLVNAQRAACLGDRVSLLLVDVRDAPIAQPLLDATFGRPSPPLGAA